MAGGAAKVEELEADEDERHQCGEDLAGAAGGEPTLHPDGDHAREEDVHGGEDGEDDECGGGERRLRDGDADGRGKEREAADDGAGGHQSKHEAEDEIAAEAQWETQQRGGVEAGDGGGDAGSVDGDELPYEGDAPEQYAEPLRMAIVDRHPCEEARAYSGADDPEREDGPEEDAQDDGDDQPGDLAGAGLAAESVDEDAPAQPGDGEELGAGWDVGPAQAEHGRGTRIGWGTRIGDKKKEREGK